MAAGKLSSRRLTGAYIARIRTLDQSGPRINSVIELNPQALEIAGERDSERRTGRLRGPLHGVPILLKDNIATADSMSTSAGSLALDGVRATRDAHVVALLREAGAVILGKTNLSEWANIRSSRSTSGWSARGGLTRNPYALDRNTSGSSSGSAAAIAAGLAAAALGTETDGSIVSPSSINGLVGIKPTVGLVSRDGIIPISPTQDTAGPMTRTVADAALLLERHRRPRPSRRRDGRSRRGGLCGAPRSCGAPRRPARRGARRVRPPPRRGHDHRRGARGPARGRRLAGRPGGAGRDPGRRRRAHRAPVRAPGFPAGLAGRVRTPRPGRAPSPR